MTRLWAAERTGNRNGWICKLARTLRSAAAFPWQGVLALLLSTGAMAADVPTAVNAFTPPAQPLGRYMRILEESGDRLDLTAARQAFTTPQATAATSPVLGIGIGHRPIWAQLLVNNPTHHPLVRQLAVGPSWTDELEVHVYPASGDASHWYTGDALPGARYLDASLGYLFTNSFPPGRSEVLIRIATPDPMILNVQLLTPDTQTRQTDFTQYSYGFFYGFLAALAFLNLIMYFGLGRRNSLYYSLFLISFIILNLSHTGRGLAWLWPASPYFQRYVILFFMVLVAGTGLKFAREFLELYRLAPALDRGIQWACRSVTVWMLVTVIFDLHLAAAFTAFMTAGIFSVSLIPLGYYAYRRGQTAAGYFLASGIVSTIGLCASTFSVWGLLPFNPWTYRSVELSLMIEAILLQLALVQFIRVQFQKRQDAERDARLDTLTQMNNRRGFVEQAEAAYSVALRHQRPLSIVILDIDHFKQINDSHGHAVGDEVLVSVGRTLHGLFRSGDCLARWGGEEFIMILPETELPAAADFCERARQALEETAIIAQSGVHIRITASFGVAQLSPDQSLEKLIIAADDALYNAKQSGRNRVAFTKHSVQDSPKMGAT